MMSGKYCITGYLRTVITILVLSCGMCVHGQQLDSLQAALKERAFDDTTAARLCLQIAKLYSSSSPDSQIIFGRKGVQIALKTTNERLKGDCFACVAFGYGTKNEKDSSLNYYQHALQHYQRAGNLRAQAATLTSIGGVYSYSNKFDMAFDTWNLAIKTAAEAHDDSIQGAIYQNYSYAYGIIGNFPLALDYALKSLTAFEKAGSRSKIVNTLVSIGNIYASLGDYKKALSYVDQCLAMQSAIADANGKLENYVNIAMIYGQMNDNDNSLKFFNNALKLADSTHNEYYKSICLVDIAETYYETGDFARALPMYKDCLSRAEKEQDPDGISMAENAIGNILIHNGQVQQGITHLRTSLAITTANGVKLQIAQTAGSLSAAYEKLHDFKHALEYHNMYARYQDSVFNETSKRKVQQLQFDYQLEKKQAQIELLNKDKLIEKGRSEKQQTMLWGLVCGLGLLLIIIVLLSRSRQSEKKSKEQFFVQKQEIEEQAQALEALNGFKDKTFSVLSHDLRGPLATFTTTMSLLDDNLLSPEEFSELKPEVNKQLSALNNLLDNLLQWSKSHMKGDVSVHPARVDLHKMLTDNVVLASGAAGGKGIEIETRIPAALYAWADPGQVDIVIRNLLSNAVKFTNPGGRITVSAVVAGAEIQLAFADNGVGLTKDQLDRLFTPAAGNNTYGTGGEKGIGLGLLLCYEFVRANGGTIAATSEPGKGTVFTISLPAAPQS